MHVIGQARFSKSIFSIPIFPEFYSMIVSNPYGFLIIFLVKRSFSSRYWIAKWTIPFPLRFFSDSIPVNVAARGSSSPFPIVSIHIYSWKYATKGRLFQKTRFLTQRQMSPRGELYSRAIQMSLMFDSRLFPRMQ